MDFMGEPVHIQDIIPKIVEFLKGKNEASLEDDELVRRSWSESGVDTLADSSISLMGGLLSTRSSRQSVLSGLWLGMFGYSRYKPKELYVVFIALHTTSELASEVSESGSMPSKEVRGSGRGLGGAGSCWRSFQVNRFFRTARPAALISGSGTAEDWKWERFWEVSMGGDLHVQVLVRYSRL